MNKTELYVYLSRKLEDWFNLRVETNVLAYVKAYDDIVDEIRATCDAKDAYRYECTRVDEAVARARVKNIFGDVL